nr:PREDICTED: disks large-associated protein 5 isoform X1 [Latimeria chalumnae]|eukprot:XP_006012169.2 PREDICTED: disks large-associated protein 5 isoform X1 [Latimeria chalumnae]
MLARWRRLLTRATAGMADGMGTRSRFADLYKKMSSVDSIRAQATRRRSIQQKENRYQEFRKSRGCFLEDPLEDGEVSHRELDGDFPENLQQKRQQESGKKVMSVARKEKLQRWKEEKQLRKLKEQQERAKHPVFKVGRYRPDDLIFIPPPGTTLAPAAKEKIAAPVIKRMTRSVTKKLAEATGAKTLLQAAVQPGVNGPVKSAPLSGNRPAHQAAPSIQSATRQTRGTPQNCLPPLPKEKKPQSKVGTSRPNTRTKQEKIEPEAAGQPRVKESARSQPKAAALSASATPLLSFAPSDYTFQPLEGLPVYPVSPHSDDAFLMPTATWDLEAKSSTVPAGTTSGSTTALQGRLRSGDLQVLEPQNSEHDVPYFRDVVQSTTERLINLSHQWEGKLEQEEIPEEVKDQIRTTVGQARLLVAERFHQFKGLVDNCEFRRGEKVTTCADLDGFWDMVYFQVEDVVKKFGGLEMLQEKSWQEQTEPQALRGRKAPKKPVCSAPKPSVDEGARAAARSRLAMAKAMMKARKAELESAVSETVEVFGAKVFKAESPMKGASEVPATASPRHPPATRSSTRLQRLSSLASFSSPALGGPQLTTALTGETPGRPTGPLTPADKAWQSRGFMEKADM